MIVVLGAGGQLGSAFLRLLGRRATGLTRADLDLTDLDTISQVLDRLAPELVVNCAAYTAVDAAEDDEATARRVNAEAVEVLARWTHRAGAKLVTFSTDYVFDGTKETPYVESDPPRPINVYGETKRAGEVAALATDPEALVVRTSWLLSSTHPNFVTTILRLLP
ncbi:MAG TPA: NAD(P)-dependent oxidoreductase, partial [Actinobacteria bacterium]|nr:NAD(P)-dependent oxidoreductase [Actinomycetota bacterium]